MFLLLVNIVLLDEMRTDHGSLMLQFSERCLVFFIYNSFLLGEYAKKNWIDAHLLICTTSAIFEQNFGGQKFYWSDEIKTK